MTKWEFIERNRAWNEGWICESDGIILGHHEDGATTCIGTLVCTKWLDDGTKKYRIGWQVSRYEADWELSEDLYDVDREIVKNLVGDVELLNLVSTEEIPTPWEDDF